jgi:2-succinyl-5-enolpyruvyl-6-hydroxy-3-cyclohexene-1-carboxylate synthase
MFSNKNNVNQLTSLLKLHDVEFAVVCPGSRNAPIVHNLNEAGIECFPVTDERSAGFYALGMSLKIGLKPVAVCVTSGTALLNLMPAVAEAYYQHVPLIIISADRPADKIDQLDGQTLHQPNALEPHVLKSVNIPEAYTLQQHIHNNRLINEAINATQKDDGGPVHINMPLTEPLYEFTEKELFEERLISVFREYNEYFFAEPIANAFLQTYKKPLIIIGQNNYSPNDLNELSKHCVIINESLSGVQIISNADEIIASSKDIDALRPDLVIYLGSTIVSKRIKEFLRNCYCEDFVINASGALTDTFNKLTTVIQTDPETMLYRMEETLRNMEEKSGMTDFVKLWNDASDRCRKQTETYKPEYSQMAAVRDFEAKLGEARPDVTVFYANSSAVRLGNIYAPLYKRHVLCNRGVNGIEGSLSTAAGASVLLNDLTYCVIGDLSFFYDQNALWNQNLRGNLRILLLNNGKGGIFHMLPGLEQSAARDTFVAAEHHATAEGICQQNRVRYLKATNMEEMQEGVDTLTREACDTPMLLEVFTNPADDQAALRGYYQALSR